MFGMGMPEFALILVVALVLLGPRRLPEMARTLGKGLAEFRKVTGDVNKELQGARDLIEREAREHERSARRDEPGQSNPTSPQQAAAPAAKTVAATPAGDPTASRGSSEESGQADENTTASASNGESAEQEPSPALAPSQTDPSDRSSKS